VGRHRRAAAVDLRLRDPSVIARPSSFGPIGPPLPSVPWQAAHVLRIAFLSTLPVAFRCIFILGFQTSNTRVLAHSILGTFFYGVLPAISANARIPRRSPKPKLLQAQHHHALPRQFFRGK
jgi:hypothetical protein